MLLYGRAGVWFALVALPDRALASEQSALLRDHANTHNGFRKVQKVLDTPILNGRSFDVADTWIRSEATRTGFERFSEGATCSRAHRPGFMYRERFGDHQTVVED